MTAGGDRTCLRCRRGSSSAPSAENGPVYPKVTLYEPLTSAGAPSATGRSTTGLRHDVTIAAGQHDRALHVCIERRGIRGERDTERLGRTWAIVNPAGSPTVIPASPV